MSAMNPTLLASLTFLAPAWALGLVAAALPLAAHLLGRRGGRPAAFPAARFVLEAEAGTRRFSRLRDATLLALRTAALVLIVLAFMQPTWRTAAFPAAAAGGGGAGRHVALILDRTASMGRAERGHILFERARRRAVTRLRDLDPSTDRASVILLEARPRAVLPEPTANIDRLIEAIEALQPGHEHGQVAEAVRRARALHQRLPEPTAQRLQIELLTDAQATQWAEDEVTAAMSFGEDRAALRMHRFGSFRSNDALHAPSVQPSEPIVNQPASVSIRVMRYADEPGQRTVELRTGDQRVTRRVALEPFTERTLDFSITFTDVGPAALELRFVEADDALPLDDRVGRVVRVRPSRPVHLFTEADVDDPDSAAFFVRRGLAPADQAEDEAQVFRSAGVSLAHHSASALPELVSMQDDERASVLVLVEANTLTTEQLEALHAHLRSGGGAIWLIDSPAAVETLSRFHELTGEAPIVPRGAERGDGWQRDAPRALGFARFDAPIMSAFEGSARAALLEGRFSATMHGEPHPQAEALLRFEDGEPALGIKDVGAGRLAVLAADLAPAASDFARGPMLVPLLHQMVRQLAPGPPPAANPKPGEPLPALEGEGVLTPPHGAPREWTGDEAAVGERVGAPGLYALRRPSSDELLDGVWAELDPRESDLRPMTTPRAGAGEEMVSADAMVTLIDEAEEVEAREVSLWPWMMLAAVVVLLVEPVALMWLRRAGAQPGFDATPRTRGAADVH